MHTYNLSAVNIIILNMWYRKPKTFRARLMDEDLLELFKGSDICCSYFS